MTLSIIIPCYNSEHCIGRCLDSILSQPTQDYEVIAVNDGSKDGTVNILRQYEAKSGKVVVIDKPNGGVSSARNVGIEVARGEYLAFVDSDDMIVEGALARVIDRANKSSEVDLFFLGMESSVNGEVLSKEYYEGEGEKVTGCDFIARKMLTTFASPWAKLYKRRMIEEGKVRFREDRHLYEDALFNLDVLSANPVIGVVKGPFYNYIMMAGSSSRRFFGDEVVNTVEEIRSRRRQYFESLGAMTSDIEYDINRDAAFVYLFAIYSIYRGKGVRNKLDWTKKYWAAAEAGDRQWSQQLNSGMPRVVAMIGRYSKVGVHVLLMSVFGLKRLKDKISKSR